MWIIGNFSDTQILRETNFRDSRKPKAAIFAISEILNVDFWEISALKKCKTSKWKIRASYLDCKTESFWAFDLLQKSAKIVFT